MDDASAGLRVKIGPFEEPDAARPDLLHQVRVGSLADASIRRLRHIDWAQPLGTRTKQGSNQSQVDRIDVKSGAGRPQRGGHIKAPRRRIAKPTKPRHPVRGPVSPSIPSGKVRQLLEGTFKL